MSHFFTWCLTIFIRRLFHFLIKARHIHSNMQQLKVKELDDKAKYKTKGRMFRNSMLRCIITSWIQGFVNIGSGYGILRLGLHCKHLQRYFTQIIRLESHINKKYIRSLSRPFYKRRGKEICELSEMLGFQYLHLLWGNTSVPSLSI